MLAIAEHKAGKGTNRQIAYNQDCGSAIPLDPDLNPQSLRLPDPAPAVPLGVRPIRARAFTDFHGQLGLAGACIANGLTTEREIAHFFNALDQDGYLCDVSLVLDRGAGVNHKRRLWALTPTGHYELRD